MASIPHIETKERLPTASPPTTPSLQQRPFGGFNQDKTKENINHYNHNNQLPTPVTPKATESPSYNATFSPIVSNIYPQKRNLQEELLLSNLSVLNDDIDLDIQHKLGEGSNSAVHLCAIKNKYSTTFTNCAIKIPFTSKKNDIIKREAIILSEIQRSNVPFSISFHGIYNYGDRACLVMEKMDCDLQSYLESLAVKETDDLALDTPLWNNLFNSLIMSLKAMQAIQIVHCDLKTSNILVNKNTQTFKICDFSSAKRLDTSNSGMEPDTTLQFLAPELLSVHNKSNHNYSTDLYAAGLILFHAATGKQPYNDYLNGSLFQLINLIKNHSVLDMLDDKSYSILNANPKVCSLLKKIIVQRCDVQDLQTIS